MISDALSVRPLAVTSDQPHRPTGDAGTRDASVVFTLGDPQPAAGDPTDQGAIKSEARDEDPAQPVSPDGDPGGDAEDDADGAIELDVERLALETAEAPRRPAVATHAADAPTGVAAFSAAGPSKDGTVVETPRSGEPAQPDAIEPIPQRGSDGPAPVGSAPDTPKRPPAEPATEPTAPPKASVSHHEAPVPKPEPYLDRRGHKAELRTKTTRAADGSAAVAASVDAAVRTIAPQAARAPEAALAFLPHLSQVAMTLEGGDEAGGVDDLDAAAWSRVVSFSDAGGRGISEAVGSGPAQTARAVGAQLVAATRTMSDGTVQVALNPEELGSVRITMTGEDTRMTIVIAVERPETLDLMRRHVADLAEAFGEMGYDDVSFSFHHDGERGPDEGGGSEADAGDVALLTLEDASPHYREAATMLRDRLDLRL